MDRELGLRVRGRRMLEPARTVARRATGLRLAWYVLSLQLSAVVGVVGAVAHRHLPVPMRPVPLHAASYYGGRFAGRDGIGSVRAISANQGVMFRASLDPRTTYRLTIDPVRPSVSFTMRMRSTRREPFQYFQAPLARMSYVVRGSNLQVLFYRSTAGRSSTYDMRMTLMPCPGCLTDRRLKQEMLTRVPGLRAALARGNALAAATAVMQWAAPQVPFTGEPDRMLPSYWATSPADALSSYRTGRVGGDCGPNAMLLQKLLQLVGIRSFLVDYGDRRWLTDILVVVPYRSASGHRLGVLSPIFDEVLTSRVTNEPLDLLQALSLVRTHRSNEIGAATGDLGHRRILAPRSRRDRSQGATCNEVGGRSEGCGLSAFLAAGYARKFVARGLSPSVAGLVELLSRTQMFKPTAYGVPPDVYLRYRQLRIGGGDRVAHH